MLSKFRILLFLLLFLASPVLAEPILQPPSLNPGDPYRLAFVTSTTTTAESDDIETYNQFVQATADAGPIGEFGLSWKAIAGTATVSARENSDTEDTDESVPIFALDGSLLIPNYSDMWNSSVFTPSLFDVDEFGIAFDSPDPPLLFVRTGSGPDGFLSPDEGLGAGRSVIGRGDLSGFTGWFGGGSTSAEVRLPLYGISETLIAVPEPSSQTLVLGAAGCVAIFFTTVRTPRERRQR